MSQYAIQVRDLGKRYTIGAYQGRYKSLRDSLVNTVTAPFRRFGKNGAKEQDERIFWALKDVSFNIEHGEVVGIIGRNGAGKSTLLKLLARITEPTTGEIRMRGRVGSLLEVGTGFHPELTGRENIFLNGAILGMSRKEIERKFDEIVDFAEIEKFIDTPAKHYSSGMYMRLAFAVAAHLEPEILLVDEVLAVGDIQFQKKCLGKMGEVAKQGRTVLFVSHNMGAVLRLCKRGILLRAGQLDYRGDINETVSRYNSYVNNSQLSVEKSSRRGGSGGARFTEIWVADEYENKKNGFSSQAPLTIHLKAKLSTEYISKSSLVIGFGLDSLDGTRVFTGVSEWVGKFVNPVGETFHAIFNLPFLPLATGEYLISASISYAGDTLDYVEHCERIEVTQTNRNEINRTSAHGYISIPYTFGVTDVL